MSTFKIAAGAATLFLFALGEAGAVPPAPSIDLAPHRAIYDMSLQNAVAGSNVSELRGRMVFDFGGSACAGYSLKLRMVTEIIDRDGKSSLTDLRSSTWEHADGGKFRFNSSQYVDQQLNDRVVGSAARRPKSGPIDITIDKPSKQKLKMDGSALFPTQHSLAILEAAREGTHVVQANIYDGAEKGDKLYETTTFIGSQVEPAADGGVNGLANAERLSGLASWPVTISYFERAAGVIKDEGLPSYELSFRLFANGVSRDLLIDYGNFSIKGVLSRIDFREPAACTEKKATRK
jgi:hypothetical protein